VAIKLSHIPLPESFSRNASNIDLFPLAMDDRIMSAVSSKRMW
jgi:hypothetical protein